MLQVETGSLFYGYHGWHDWYLAANLGDASNLAGQLLPGLDPLGVPRQLKDTALPFNYNQLHELDALVDKYPDEIGVIIMEPRRERGPDPGFLEGVRKIADRIGAVLVFDEVTSGFRINLGGIHLTYEVEPDIAVFGKALGNGFPIAAVIGKKEIMDAAQNTFISSTMWAERIGFAAALATIEKMEKSTVQKELIHHGEQINTGWKVLAQKHDLQIKISGITPLTHISFTCDDPLAVQTLYTQEMLSKGYLLGPAVYMSFPYSEKIIDDFLHESDSVFADL